MGILNKFFKSIFLNKPKTNQPSIIHPFIFQFIKKKTYIHTEPEQREDPVLPIQVPSITEDGQVHGLQSRGDGEHPPGRLLLRSGRPRTREAEVFPQGPTHTAGAQQIGCY